MDVFAICDFAGGDVRTYNAADLQRLRISAASGELKSPGWVIHHDGDFVPQLSFHFRVGTEGYYTIYSTKGAVKDEEYDGALTQYAILLPEPRRGTRRDARKRRDVVPIRHGFRIVDRQPALSEAGRMLYSQGDDERLGEY